MSPRATGPRGPYAKTAQRREEILAAAREVFASSGYRNGSVQEIADRVGLSQSAVLHHFPAKEDLLLAVLADRDVRGEDVTGGLSLVDGVLAQATHNENTPGIIDLYTTLCAESTAASHPAHDYFAKRFADSRDSFSEQFRTLGVKGLLRPGVDPDLAGAGLVALWDGIQLQWLMARDGESAGIDVPQALRHYLSLVLTDEASTPLHSVR
jgi:AcrR family transcriptional regulator